jgi:hypothetical protein
MADVKREQEAKEAALRGSEEMRAALKPGRIFRFTADVCQLGHMGTYVLIQDALWAAAPLPPDHPKYLRKGGIAMLISAERVEDKQGIRRACYVFLVGGMTKKCVISDLALLEPIVSIPKRYGDQS